MNAKHYFEQFKSISIQKKILFFLLFLLRVAVAYWCLTVIERFLFPVRYGIINIGNVAPIMLCVLLMVCLVFPFIPRDIWQLFGKARALRILRGALLGLLVFAVAYSGALYAFIRGAEENLPEEDSTTLVVLGCKLYGDIPSPMLSQRIRTATQYLSDHPNAVCVVSGGQGSDETATEASVMKRRLVETGIDESRIYVEEHSFDTLENLKNSAEIIEREDLPRRITIVTDGYHQFRAQYRARQLGYECAGLPAPTDRILRDTYYVREIFACTAMFLLG